MGGVLKDRGRSPQGSWKSPGPAQTVLPFLSMNKELLQSSNAWGQCQDSLLFLLRPLLTSFLLTCRTGLQGEEEEGMSGCSRASGAGLRAAACACSFLPGHCSEAWSAASCTQLPALPGLLLGTNLHLFEIHIKIHEPHSLARAPSAG